MSAMNRYRGDTRGMLRELRRVLHEQGRLLDALAEHAE